MQEFKVFCGTLCLADIGKAKLVLPFHSRLLVILICIVILFHFTCGYCAGVLVL